MGHLAFPHIYIYKVQGTTSRSSHPPTWKGLQYTRWRRTWTTSASLLSYLSANLHVSTRQVELAPHPRGAFPPVQTSPLISHLSRPCDPAQADITTVWPFVEVKRLHKERERERESLLCRYAYFLLFISLFIADFLAFFLLVSAN